MMQHINASNLIHFQSRKVGFSYLISSLGTSINTYIVFANMYMYTKEYVHVYKGISIPVQSDVSYYNIIS